MRDLRAWSLPSRRAITSRCSADPCCPTRTAVTRSRSSAWRAERLDVSGNLIGFTTLPIADTAGEARLTALRSGGYLVTWLDASSRLVGRYFTSSGDAAGDVFVIAASVSMHMTALIGPV